MLACLPGPGDLSFQLLSHTQMNTGLQKSSREPEEDWDCLREDCDSRLAPGAQEQLGEEVEWKRPQGRGSLTWETGGTAFRPIPSLLPSQPIARAAGPDSPRTANSNWGFEGQGPLECRNGGSLASFLPSSVWQTPEMLVEIETAWSLSGYLLVCFSAGYFIHDTVDIVVSRQARASWEYLVHHVMAMGAFFSGIFWSSFVGGGVLTLLVEVSNIFLTIRMMMKINNAQDLLLYRVNKYVNLVMYFLFRLAPQAYLTHFFLRYTGQRNLGTFLLGILLMLDVMILIYFSRLLRSDFCPERVPSQKHKDKFLTE
ncbi:TLC domain-containing protein 1 isoform X3 [Elephas maximus indicus]|uniref:TLC domain-containing protein 1 isoform X3 n=1 Tax=Elephas maximus indicus TaxID=99487 RepID=UPI002116F248|nr:TLC domain-containing protein 1 isoform X3 [Elephas maximus indicus]